MSDKQVKIQANCQPAPPALGNVKKVDTVTFDPQTNATVDFGSQANWPFQGSYQTINLVNGTPQTFSMKEPECGTEVTYEYSVSCEEFLAAGSGKIIIKR